MALSIRLNGSPPFTGSFVKPDALHLRCGVAMMICIPSLLRPISFSEIGTAIIKRNSVKVIDLFVAIHQHPMKAHIPARLAFSALSGSIESARPLIPSGVPLVDGGARVVLSPDDSDLPLSQGNESTVNALNLERERVCVGFSRFWRVVMIYELVKLALDNSTLRVINFRTRSWLAAFTMAIAVGNSHDPLPIGRRHDSGESHRLTLVSKASARCCLSSVNRIA